MRPTRPPQIAPNGQIFDPSASAIPPPNKKPATKLVKDQTEKLNFLFIVQKSTKTANVFWDEFINLRKSTVSKGKDSRCRVGGQSARNHAESAAGVAQNTGAT